MTRPLSVAQHPLALAAAALLGALMAVVFPVVTPLMAVINAAFVALLQMAALPLMAVAVIFGLRRLLELPHPGHRSGLLVAAGASLVVGASVMGFLAASFFTSVLPVTDADREQLSVLIHAADQTTALTLSQDRADSREASGWSRVIPANLFEVLVDGRIPAMVMAAVLFGLALHLQPGTGPRAQTTRSAYALLEAGYRALETLIEQVARAAPIAAWAMAGHAASQISLEHLTGMWGLVLPLATCTALWGLAAVVVSGFGARVSPGQALMALGRPLCISLLASAPGASIPGYISAMSERLGYSRGVVELLIPTAPFFLKVGEALYFPMLFVFLCGLYDKPVGWTEAGLIITAGCWAALVSVQLPLARTLTAGTLGLVWLDLPIDAVVPILLGLELLTFGLRQMVSDVAACLLVAWATRDVATAAAVPLAGWMNDEWSQAVLGQVVLRRPLLLSMAALATAALVLAFMLGMGLGLRAA